MNVAGLRARGGRRCSENHRRWSQRLRGSRGLRNRSRSGRRSPRRCSLRRAVRGRCRSARGRARSFRLVEHRARLCDEVRSSEENEHGAENGRPHRRSRLTRRELRRRLRIEMRVREIVRIVSAPVIVVVGVRAVLLVFHAGAGNTAARPERKGALSGPSPTGEDRSAAISRRCWPCRPGRSRARGSMRGRNRRTTPPASYRPWSTCRCRSSRSRS